ncbi:MAG TPA: CvpA family protein [Bacillales bacterium]|nr:CvpA family protein [Bacillales bacterium]
MNVRMPSKFLRGLVKRQYQYVFIKKGKSRNVQMLTLIILVVLIAGFFIGLRRGLIYEIIHLTGFVAAFIVAYLYFDDIASRLRLWIPYPGSGAGEGVAFFSDALNLEEAYYRGIAFAMLFFGTKIILHILGTMLDFLAELPLLRTVNRWLGGAFGFVEVYLLVFLLLSFAALVPLDFIQNAVGQSGLAQTIVQHTPIFSAQIKELWMSPGGV